MVSTTYLWWFGGWFNYYCFNHITIFGGNSDPYISARLGWAAGSQAFEAPKSPGPDRKTPRRPDVSETWKEHDGSVVFVDGGQNKADPNQDLTSHHMRCQGYDFEGNHLPWQTVHTGATPPGTKDGMSCTRTVDFFQCVFGVSMGLRCFLDSHEIAGVSRCVGTGTIPLYQCLWCGLKLPMRSILQAPPFDTRWLILGNWWFKGFSWRHSLKAV